VSIPTEQQIDIRLATALDAEEISRVLQDSFEEFRDLYTKEAFDATAPEPETIRKRMAEGPVWVAVSDDDVVGTAAAEIRSDGCYLRGMAVRPGSRVKGVGLGLLTAAEQFATENHSQRIYLSTTPFLARAISLYVTFGFRKTADGPHDLHKTPLLTMSKDLAPCERADA